jgi:hypothetical protein
MKCEPSLKTWWKMKIVIESYKNVYVFVYKDETTKLITPKLKLNQRTHATCRRK